MQEKLTVSISFGTIVKTILFILLLWALWELLNLVLVVLTAVVIASAIEPATKWFSRYRVPRVLGVLIIYVIVFAILFGIVFFFIPPLLDDLKELSSQLPGYLESINLSNENSFETISNGVLPETITDSFSISEAIDSLSKSINELSGNIFKLVSTIFGGALSFVLIIVMSFYLAVQERGIENFLDIITPIKYEKYVIDLWQRSQRKIGLWLQGQLLLGLLVGILVYLALTVFQVRYALLLAVIAAIFELIPIFGPILAAIPAVLIGLLDGGISKGLFVVLLYVIIQQFENHLLYPLVVRQVVGVPSIIAIVALVAGGTLAGLLGMILSVPLAAVFMELFNDLDKEKHHLKKIAEEGAS
jgi:predicted PurR-regulated permease PerM